MLAPAQAAATLAFMQVHSASRPPACTFQPSPSQVFSFLERAVPDFLSSPGASPVSDGAGSSNKSPPVITHTHSFSAVLENPDKYQGYGWCGSYRSSE